MLRADGPMEAQLIDLLEGGLCTWLTAMPSEDMGRVVRVVMGGNDGRGRLVLYLLQTPTHCDGLFVWCSGDLPDQ